MLLKAKETKLNNTDVIEVYIPQDEIIDTSELEKYTSFYQSVIDEDLEPIVNIFKGMNYLNTTLFYIETYNTPAICYEILLECCDKAEITLEIVNENQKPYNIPTQIIFLDAENTKLSGIAYHSMIISADNGAIYSLEEITILQSYSDWVDFSEDIK